MASQRIYLPAFVALTSGSASFVVKAQETEALAKQLANPIASLTSAPMPAIRLASATTSKRRTAARGGVCDSHSLCRPPGHEAGTS